jgi:hypothetical protein
VAVQKCLTCLFADTVVQVFVESLDRSFENVCELDLIFHFDEVSEWPVSFLETAALLYHAGGGQQRCHGYGDAQLLKRDIKCSGSRKRKPRSI